MSDFEDTTADPAEGAACADGADQAYWADTAYTLQDPTGAPVFPGDVLPYTMTIGGPVSSPFTFVPADDTIPEMEIVAPQPDTEVSDAPTIGIIGGPQPGWVTTDVNGNPVNPFDILPSQGVIGGPSSSFEILSADGNPMSPGDLLPHTFTIGGPRTGPDPNPVMMLTEMAAQSQDRLAQMEWEAVKPDEPYPSGKLPAQVFLELMSDPDASSADIERYKDHIDRINAVIRNTIDGMGAQDE